MKVAGRMAQTGVERTLGILLAKVEGIERSIQAGDQHRATVHRRVDELVSDLGVLKTNVAGITKDVGDMKQDISDTKTVTDEVKRWQLMGVGALFVTGIAASAIASALTYFWADIWRALRGG